LQFHAEFLSDGAAGKVVVLVQVIDADAGAETP